ncbi:MAG: hypothetical protein GY716_00140 [bacterium]|nr:hypothetical protein [bacterium]
MKHKRLPPALWIPVALLALLAIPHLAPSPSAASAPAFNASWKAVASTGSVEALLPVETVDSWARVGRGDRLEPLTQVRTGRRGRATLTRQANIMIIEPETRVELPTAVSGAMSSVIQTEGSVLYEIETKDKPHFEVVTPYLTAGVKGTEFLVTVNEQYTAVTVDDGLVEVVDAETGERFDVRPGEALIRDLESEQLELIDIAGNDVRRSGTEHRVARAEAGRLARMDRAGRMAGTDDDVRASDLHATRPDTTVNASVRGDGEFDEESSDADSDLTDRGAADDTLVHSGDADIFDDNLTPDDDSRDGASQDDGLDDDSMSKDPFDAGRDSGRHEAGDAWDDEPGRDSKGERAWPDDRDDDSDDQGSDDQGSDDQGSDDQGSDDQDADNQDDDGFGPRDDSTVPADGTD